MYENVTFPEEGEGDIGRAVQSAFAPVVEKGDAVDATEKKKKTILNRMHHTPKHTLTTHSLANSHTVTPLAHFPLSGGL